MGHLHSVHDTDAHLKINAITRVITNASSGKTVLIQCDHNSERFTFEVPRIVDGHDLSKCNVAQIHYINIDSANKENTSTGVYEADDLQISPDSNDVVILSWLISGNATKYAGSLNFLVKFKCVDDSGEVVYIWNTAIYTGISVSSGIDNGEDVVEEYADVLERWRQELIDTGGVTDDRIEQAVANYMAENPDSSQNANSGMSQTLRVAIYNLLMDAVYQSPGHEADKAALEELLSGGSSEPDIPDVPGHTHSYTSSVTTAATCTTAGVKTFTCSCGHSYTQSIPATGHNYVDGVCTVCGAADPNYAAGGNTLLYNWDFTKSLTDTASGQTATINGAVVQDVDGVTLVNNGDYVGLGEIYAIGRTYELDIADSETSFAFSNNGRLLMHRPPTSWGAAQQHTMGVVYRGTTATWAIYENTWTDPDTNHALESIKGKTVRYTVTESVVEFYIDDVLIASMPPYVTENRTMTIGSENNTLCGVTITGLRVYEGVA